MRADNPDSPSTSRTTVSSPVARWAVMNANTSAVVTADGSTGNNLDQPVAEAFEQHRFAPAVEQDHRARDGPGGDVSADLFSNTVEARRRKLQVARSPGGVFRIRSRWRTGHQQG